MKNNRRVVIKNEKLKKIRNNLRLLLIYCVYGEDGILANFSSLYNDILSLTSEEEKELYYLQGTRHELIGGLYDSICMCSLCGKHDRDMVYIKSHNGWYCTKCQDKEYIWYPWMGGEEVNPNRGFIKAHKERIKLEKMKNERIKKQ